MNNIEKPNNLKKVRIVVVIAVSIILLTSLSGCINDSGDGSNDGEEDGSTWNAYEFEGTVEPAEGDSGELKEYTFEETYNENGTIKRFEVQVTVLGKEEANMPVERIDPTTGQSEKIDQTLNCYKLEHHIEVLQDDEGLDHPDWAEVTVYIPVDEYDSSDASPYFGIYSRMDYEDSDGNEGMWSYHLTEEMKEKQQNQEAYYSPYTEGESHQYDNWVLHGMYGWAWTWFRPFAEDTQFSEGEASVSTGPGSYSYSVEKTTENVSGYEFTAWDVSCSAVTFEGGGSLEGTFSTSLPVPIYLKVGGGDQQHYSYYEVELMSVTLE